MSKTNEPKQVILHCADTNDSPQGFIHDIEDVKKWHTDQPPMGNGWSDIGYHVYVRRDGMIQFGRPEDVQGAHVFGHNKNTLGVCYEGRHLPTPAQMVSLIELYRKYWIIHGIGYQEWKGHNEFDGKKKCPGFNMAHIRNLLKLIELPTRDDISHS